MSDDLQARLEGTMRDIKKVIGAEVIGTITGLTVEKTKNTLMLTPDSREGIFVLTYINDIGDHITIPVTTTSLHIEMREQEYKPFPTEKKIQIDAYQD